MLLSMSFLLKNVFTPWGNISVNTARWEMIFITLRDVELIYRNRKKSRNGRWFERFQRSNSINRFSLGGKCALKEIHREKWLSRVRWKFSLPRYICVVSADIWYFFFSTERWNYKIIHSSKWFLINSSKSNSARQKWTISFSFARSRKRINNVAADCRR